MFDIAGTGEHTIGNMIVRGNLTISGDTTTISSPIYVGGDLKIDGNVKVDSNYKDRLMRWSMGDIIYNSNDHRDHLTINLKLWSAIDPKLI